MACCLDITLDPAAFTVACFRHRELHCTILALTNEHITFPDSHTLTSFGLEYGRPLAAWFHLVKRLSPIGQVGRTDGLSQQVEQINKVADAYAGGDLIEE